MPDFKVKTYNTLDNDTWNNFVLNSNQDTFLFQRAFMEYHSDRFEDFSLMVYKDEALIALLPANRVANALHSHQGLTYGGLIYSGDFSASDVIYAFKAILKYLVNNDIETLYLKELPSIFLFNAMNNALPYVLFKTKADLYRTDMHSVLDLKFKSYSNSRKKGYKRGAKFNLKVEESHTFNEFWNGILIPNLTSKHNVKPVHSLEEITHLKSKFKKNIRQFNVIHNNEIVAGTTIFETKNVAHSQYISGNSDKNTLGSLDVLHQHLLDTVFKDKLYFNFGTSNINAGQSINQGLQYWKEGFGARSITQGFYKVDTLNYKLLEDVFV